MDPAAPNNNNDNVNDNTGVNDDRIVDDFDEEEPEFLDSNDVIEVATLDDTTDNVPMDDDDDDDDIEIDDTVVLVNDHRMDENTMEDAAMEASPELFMTVSSHTGPVYACSVMAAIPFTASTAMDNNNNSSNNSELQSEIASTTTSLVLATGGGDDIACFTRLILPDAAAVGSDVTTQQLAYHHTDSVSAVAFGVVPVSSSSPSTSILERQQQPNILLAVGGYDGMIVLYDGANGNCLMNISQVEEFKSNFAGPTDIEWLTFHKTGTVLLAGSSTDGTVWMYHVVVPSSKQPDSYYTLNCMQVFVGHASMVSAGGFTSDGRWAVSIGNSGTRDDATIRIWNPKTGIAKHTVHVHSGSTTGMLLANQYDNDNDDDSPYAGLTCLAFGITDELAIQATNTTTTTTTSTSSKLLLVGSEDGWAYICHVGTGKVLNAFRHAVDPGTPYNNTSMDVDTNHDTTELLLSVEAVGFCPSNPMWCATGGADGVLKIWDLNNGQCRHACRYTSPTTTTSDLRKTKASTIGGITRLHWLPTTTTTTTTIGATALPNHPPIVFVATTDGMVHVWDARNGGLLRTIQTGGRATINDLQILPITNNNRVVIVTASEDESVRLFELNLAELLQPPAKLL